MNIRDGRTTIDQPFSDVEMDIIRGSGILDSLLKYGPKVFDVANAALPALGHIHKSVKMHKNAKTLDKLMQMAAQTSDPKAMKEIFDMYREISKENL